MTPETIRVTVRFGEPLRKAVGHYRIEIPLAGPASVDDFILHLAEIFAGFESSYSGQVMGRDYPYEVFVNHRHVPKEEYGQFGLGDGDVIHIIIPIAGGASSPKLPPEVAATFDRQPEGGAPGKIRSPVENVLPRSFYARTALKVAPDLLGCLVVREWQGKRLVGRVVEVEAYLGKEDAASHAYRGPTPRNQAMFGPAGIAYVYLIYGMYHCLNVVTGQDGDAQAVLIRALEPVAGLEVMRQRRGKEDVRNLTSGPGKLCQALDIDKRFDGHDLTAGSTLWLASGQHPDQAICTSPRVGVRGNDHALRASWRFFLEGNAFVSPRR